VEAHYDNSRTPMTQNAARRSTINLGCAGVLGVRAELLRAGH
jgi:hypothetical protein